MVRGSLALWLAAMLGCGATSPSSRESEADATPRTDQPDATPPIDDSGVRHQLVFATSSKQNGDLGGLSGADDMCAERAADAGLSGTFKAWLSAPEMSASDRLAHASVPYARTDGVEVAADWADLVDGELAAPIDHDEHGELIAGDVWTGTLAGGGQADVTCASFADSDDTGVCGSSDATGAEWTENIRPSCTSELRLYCVEQ